MHRSDEVDPGAVRSEHDVFGFVARTCFKTGPPGRVGIESEWFVHNGRSPAQPLPFSRLRRIADAGSPLPGGSAVTFEPGGQLELSTACGNDLAHARELLESDLGHLDKLLADDGLRRVGAGVEPDRPPVRILDTPRYAAMEDFFDRDGPAGRVMMSSTASVQVCLDAGADEQDLRRRWRRANALTPLLVAAFANSPLRLGRPTGLRCTRQAVWSQIDPGRTAPPVGDDPAEAWARYALDARVMLLRTADGTGRWRAAPGMTLRDWVRGDTAYGLPTHDDLAYHLTTLFPPVRPHGWLEIRVIDALPDELWPVAVAVTTALVDDPDAADVALDAVTPLGTTPGTTSRAAVDLVAARDALADPALQRAATTCFAAARDALPRLGADADLVTLVDRYAERYVSAGRTPADDVLDHRIARTEERL